MKNIVISACAENILKVPMFTLSRRTGTRLRVLAMRLGSVNRLDEPAEENGEKGHS